VFSVLSTSVETDQIERVVRVLQRAKIRHSINYASVYACRKIADSSSWSQHSWGNAVDLFPRGDIDSHDAVRRAIANFVVKNTTQKTTANLGRKLAVSEVIDHSGRRIWTPEKGWHEYFGTTGDHVHVSGAPLRTGTPPCA
jgi:hypothetical protein